MWEEGGECTPVAWLASGLLPLLMGWVGGTYFGEGISLVIKVFVLVHLLFAVGFLHQVSQLLTIHCLWTCENAKMLATPMMRFLRKRVLKFSASSMSGSLQIWSSESAEACLRRFMTSLSSLQGSH